MIGIVVHSAKVSEWEEHKYVKKVDGNYYYPNGYGKDRVNEIMRFSPLGSAKLSDMANSDVAKEGEKAAKKVAANTAGMDMNTVYAVYGDKFEDNRKGAPKNSKRARAR